MEKTPNSSKSISDEVGIASDTPLDQKGLSSDERVGRPVERPSLPDNRKIAVDLIIANIVPMSGLSNQTTASQTQMNELADQIIAKLVPMNGFSSLTINKVDQIIEGQSPMIKMDLVIRELDSDDRVGKPDNRESNSDDRVGKPDNRGSSSDDRVGKPDNR